MFARHKPELIFFAILIVLCFFQVALPSSWSIDTFRDPLFSKIPLNLSHWHGEDVALSERAYEILETRNILSRSYKNDKGQFVHVLIVGSRMDRRVAHPPEVCYIGSNYDIVDTHESTTQIGDKKIPSKEFLAKNKRNAGEQENVWYVYKVGSFFTTNYYAQQLLFAWNRLTRNESYVFLIRLSSSDPNLLKDFANLIIPQIP